MTSRASLGQKSLSLLMGAWLAALLNLVAGVFVARVLGPRAWNSGPARQLLDALLTAK